MKPTWSVVVVYESEVVRKRAMDFCDELVVRFWGSWGFDIYWSSFADLGSAAAAELGKRKVAQADIVVVSAEAGGEFPMEFDGWLQESLAARNEKEGALVGLFTPGESGARDGYCRNLAHSHGMDYWTELPRELAQPQPDSPEWCERRAGQVTSVLDEILQQSGTPPRLWQ